MFKDITWNPWLYLDYLSQMEKARLDYCTNLPTQFKGTINIHIVVLTFVLQ